MSGLPPTPVPSTPFASTPFPSSPLPLTPLGGVDADADWSGVGAEAVCIADTGCELGEGLCFDDLTGDLWWVDIDGRRLFRLRGGEVERWAVPARPSAVLPAEGGGVLLVTEIGILRVVGEAEALDPLVGIEADEPSRRSNDAGVHASGAVIVGTMSRESGPGRIHHVTRAGARLVDEEVVCPNGPVWTADDRMLLVDTVGSRLIEWRVDPADGAPRERLGAIDLSALAGAPDGATLDAEGGLLVASWGGSGVHRLAGAGPGEDAAIGARRIPIPVPRVTCPRWAGPELDVLVVTTAGGPERGAGGVWACRPGGSGTAPARARLD